MPDANPEWAVIVLTGGGSRRMGRDKATLDVAGTSLLDRTIADVPAGIPVVVAGPPAPVARRGVVFVQEDPPGGGPVAGIDAALAAVSAPVVVVLATDLPLVGALPSGLAEALLDARRDDADATRDALLAADASGRPQQLCAAYRADALRRAIADNGSGARCLDAQPSSNGCARPPSVVITAQRHGGARVAWGASRGRPDVGH